MKCGGCVEKITPVLNADTHIKSWSVNMEDPAKVVTVNAENISADAVAALIKSAGFSAELL